MKEKKKRIFVIEKDVIYDSDTGQEVGVIEQGKIKFIKEISCGEYYTTEEKGYHPKLVVYMILGFVAICIVFIMILLL